jgi:uncharacterized protein
MSRDEAIQLLRSRLDELRRFHVRSLSLFGSVARNEAGPESDLDVLVDFSPDPTVDDYVGLSLFLEELCGRRVDLLTEDGIKPRTRALIERDIVHVT